eukprot:2697271-Prymnesium_polylepis.1
MQSGKAKCASGGCRSQKRLPHTQPRCAPLVLHLRRHHARQQRLAGARKADHEHAPKRHTVPN